MTDPTTDLPSRWACQSCGATDRVIHRTSPKGEPYAGKCANCLGGHSAQTMAGKLSEAVDPDQWTETTEGP